MIKLICNLCNSHRQPKRTVFSPHHQSLAHVIRLLLGAVVYLDILTEAEQQSVDKHLQHGGSNAIRLLTDHQYQIESLRLDIGVVLPQNY